MAQAQIVLRFRAAIDTAIAYPNRTNEASAIAITTAYPLALRSSHARHNLGKGRWKWLNERGVYPGGNDVVAFTVTAEPDIKT